MNVVFSQRRIMCWIVVFTACTPLIIKAQSQNYDLLGTWVVIGSSGAAGTKLEIAQAPGSKAVACFLTVAGGSREECTIRRTGGGFAINAQGPASSDMAPPPNHVLLGQVSGGMIEGKLLPSKESLKLYKEGGEEAGRLREAAAEESRRKAEDERKRNEAAAELRAKQAALANQRQAVAEKVVGTWHFSYKNTREKRYGGNVSAEGTVVINGQLGGRYELVHTVPGHALLEKGTKKYSGSVIVQIIENRYIQIQLLGSTFHPIDFQPTDGSWTRLGSPEYKDCCTDEITFLSKEP